jgi:hypothetical protein
MAQNALFSSATCGVVTFPTNEYGQAAFGPWVHIVSAINNEIALKNEPTGSRLEYRVRGVNKGGQSPPRNTVCVVL